MATSASHRQHRAAWASATLTRSSVARDRLAHWDMLVTVFSASYYKQEGDNTGAVMVLQPSLAREFVQYSVRS